jgi:hypothetical protein
MVMVSPLEYAKMRLDIWLRGLDAGRQPNGATPGNHCTMGVNVKLA